MVYSTRRFVLCLTLSHFVLVFFGPFGTAIASIGEERAGLGAFVRFVLVWVCRFSLPLGVWEGLRFVIVAFLGLFYLSCMFRIMNEGSVKIPRITQKPLYITLLTCIMCYIEK